MCRWRTRSSDQRRRFVVPKAQVTLALSPETAGMSNR
jgi:hypothetical protein